MKSPKYRRYSLDYQKINNAKSIKTEESLSNFLPPINKNIKTEGFDDFILKKKMSIDLEKQFENINNENNNIFGKTIHLLNKNNSFLITQQKNSQKIKNQKSYNNILDICNTEKLDEALKINKAIIYDSNKSKISSINNNNSNLFYKKNFEKPKNILTEILNKKNIENKLQNKKFNIINFKKAINPFKIIIYKKKKINIKNDEKLKEIKNFKKKNQIQCNKNYLNKIESLMGFADLMNSLITNQNNNINKVLNKFAEKIEFVIKN